MYCPLTLCRPSLCKHFSMLCQMPIGVLSGNLHGAFLVNGCESWKWTAFILFFFYAMCWHHFLSKFFLIKKTSGIDVAFVVRQSTYLIYPSICLTFFSCPCPIVILYHVVPIVILYHVVLDSGYSTIALFCWSDCLVVLISFWRYMSIWWCFLRYLLAHSLWCTFNMTVISFSPFYRSKGKLKK